MITEKPIEATRKRGRKSNVGFLVQLAGHCPADGVRDAKITRAIVMGPPRRLSVYLSICAGCEFRWDLELDDSPQSQWELERLQEVANRHRPNDSREFEGARVGLRFDRGRFVQFEAISPPRHAPPRKAKHQQTDSNTEGER